MRCLLFLFLFACQRDNGKDLDGDGVTGLDGDCNDDLPAINPNAADLVGDGVDQNCDGIDGEDADGDGLASLTSGGTDCEDQDAAIGAASTYYMDADGDGFGSILYALSECAAPEGFVLNGQDCDDLNPEANPGATEVCDEVDNDCDGNIDEDVLLTFFVDADEDGYGNDAYSIEACNPPLGYAAEAGDCDDDNPAAHSEQEDELCDGLDNNCDGQIDEGVTQIFYGDADGDGYGDATNTIEACTTPSGYVADNTDCDDNNAYAYDSTMMEICDGYDNNCDGQTDEGVTTTYYLDVDNDGQGYSDISLQACTQPSGYASVAGDCDDLNSAVHYQAIEVCDGIDNDCDGQIDTGLGTLFYADTDGDGYGDATTTIEACTTPSGYVADNTDCDDNNAYAYDSTMMEICDGYDNNCDGQADEGVSTAYYQDFDGDGYGNDQVSVEACSAPLNYVENSDDCNDLDNTISPSESELCDELDNNCDGQVDEGLTTTYYLDVDGDGYGNSVYSLEACTQPSGYSDNDTDCDDLAAAVYPSAQEVCDSTDNDCDGDIDDDDSSLDTTTRTTYYLDNDGDGYGVSTTSIDACVVPTGYAQTDDDCDDTEATTYPNATEIQDDGIDQDCDGQDVITVLWGNLDIASDSAAVSFCQNYKSLVGTLTLKGVWADGESLSCLESVSGSLLIEIDSAIDLKLDSLSSVGVNLHVTGPQSALSSTLEASITSLSLASLTSVGGDVQATGLYSLSAPLLETVGGELYLDDFADLHVDALQSAASATLTCDSTAAAADSSITTPFDAATLCDTLEALEVDYSITDCEDDLCDGEEESEVTPSYTYSLDVAPIMSAYSCDSCHSSGLAYGGFVLNYTNLTTLNSTVTAEPYITIGDPDSSYYYLKMGSDPSLYTGDQMAPSGPPSASELQIISDWITNGAAP